MPSGRVAENLPARVNAVTAAPGPSPGAPAPVLASAAAPEPTVAASPTAAVANVTAPVTAQPAARAAEPPAPVRPPTPRVSGGGDIGSGRGLIGSRCASCHGVSPTRYSRAQWQAFFASGRHDRYEPLGDRVSAGEMASILAYLRENAADAEHDQGAGIR